MARILITGSTDGLGLMAAQLLADGGHAITLHARNAQRARDAGRMLPTAEHTVVGDLARIEQTRQVAEQANALGRYDAVIHNASIGYREPERVETVDGLSHVFAINVVAPYLLTALIAPPHRLVYLGSDMHRSGNPTFHDLQWSRADGTGPRPTRTANSSTLCWPSLSPATGQTWSQMLLSRGGCRQRWGVPAHPMTSPWPR
jgi:NAD(P)-dependent dehydrogenase (short-subunit alcohol dehydrogenase family)